MSFLKNVVTRSNDQTYLIPNDEPTTQKYVLWKAANYSTELLAAYNQITEGYRDAYANSGMWKLFKILKNAGLLGATNMAAAPTAGALKVEGKYVMVAGRKIYVDEEGFEL